MFDYPETKLVHVGPCTLLQVDEFKETSGSSPVFGWGPPRSGCGDKLNSHFEQELTFSAPSGVGMKNTQPKGGLLPEQDYI